MAPELLQCLFTRAGGVDLELLLGKELLEGVADGLFVIHDQDLDGPCALDRHSPDSLDDCPTKMAPPGRSA
jgi:hypothetical protein